MGWATFRAIFSQTHLATLVFYVLMAGMPNVIFPGVLSECLRKYLKQKKLCKKAACRNSVVKPSSTLFMISG
jgi:hypothetical protein